MKFKTPVLINFAFVYTVQSKPILDTYRRNIAYKQNHGGNFLNINPLMPGVAHMQQIN